MMLPIVDLFPLKSSQPFIADVRTIINQLQGSLKVKKFPLQEHIP